MAYVTIQYDKNKKVGHILHRRKKKRACPLNGTVFHILHDSSCTVVSMFDSDSIRLLTPLRQTTSAAGHSWSQLVQGETSWRNDHSWNTDEEWFIFNYVEVALVLCHSSGGNHICHFWLQKNVCFLSLFGSTQNKKAYFQSRWVHN